MQHIVCPQCLTTNRVPRERPAERAKCGRCHAALFDGHPAPASAEALARHIEHGDLPVVVDFWASWCGPCRAMTPVFERAAVAFEPAVRFLKVDTEAETALAAHYAIRSIPTLILFHRGTIIDRQAGALDDSRLHTWLKRHLPQASTAR